MGIFKLYGNAKWKWRNKSKFFKKKKFDKKTTKQLFTGKHEYIYFFLFIYDLSDNANAIGPISVDYS